MKFHGFTMFVINRNFKLLKERFKLLNNNNCGNINSKVHSNTFIHDQIQNII